jgi:hypothetical protein
MTPWNAQAVARRTTWARYQFTVGLAAAATYTAVDLLSNFKVDGGVTQGCTVARIHHRQTVTTAVTASTGQLAWGIMRGQNSDVGVSVVGSPQPIADPYEDWLFWEVDNADFESNLEPGAANVMVRDIRAKRKLAELQQALLWVVGPTAGLTYPATIAVSGSVLLMLP